jgi:hypothetical protein
MKKVLMSLAVFALFGSIIGCGGSDSGGKKVKPPLIEDKVSVATNMTYVSEYTYSLSNPPNLPGLTSGIIAFRGGVSKGGTSLSLSYGDITWSTTGDNVGTLSPIPGTTGAELALDGVTTGTTIVKATYLAGTIDELSSTVTIHVVP